MSKQSAAQKQSEAPEVNSASVESPVTMTKAQRKVVDGMTTVSARIRYLLSEKFTRSEITKLIPNAKGGTLLYQHVRNVDVGPTPKAS